MASALLADIFHFTWRAEDDAECFYLGEWTIVLQVASQGSRLICRQALRGSSRLVVRILEGPSRACRSYPVTYGSSILHLRSWPSVFPGVEACTHTALACCSSSACLTYRSLLLVCRALLEDVVRSCLCRLCVANLYPVEYRRQDEQSGMGVLCLVAVS